MVLVEMLISSVMHWIFVDINTCTFAHEITLSAIFEIVHDIVVTVCIHIYIYIIYFD